MTFTMPDSGTGLCRKKTLQVNDKIRELWAEAEPGKCYTLEEIGDFAGITKERVRQIEMRALQKLRLKPTVRQLKRECS